MEKKSTHGGRRPGSGRKQKEATATINFRLPVSRIKYLKEKYPKISQLFKAWQEGL